MHVSKVIGMLKNVKESQYCEASVCGAVLDSRRAGSGRIFFACKGSASDGNKFAQSAIDAGAVLAVMDDAAEYVKVQGNKVLVDDTLHALRDMGRKRLEETKAVKMVVTGSFGKTSTKEMLALVLKGSIHTYATEENNNNELGVLLTACGLPEDAGVAIFEIGSNAQGEISALSRLVNPHLGILTGVGHAHVGFFGTLYEVIKEKLSVTDGIIAGGVLIMHEAFKESFKKLERQSLLKDVFTFGASEGVDSRLVSHKVQGTAMDFAIEMEGEVFDFKIYSPYVHLGENFAGVFFASQLLGIPYEEARAALMTYKVPEGRGNIIRSGRLNIIDDTYNASLEAVLKSIDALEDVGGKKYALIGEIGEIEGHEKEIYSAIMAKAAEYKDIHFIFAGESYKNYAPAKNIEIIVSKKDVEKRIMDITAGTILIKASHSYRFDSYRDMMIANTGSQNAI